MRLAFLRNVVLLGLCVASGDARAQPNAGPSQVIASPAISQRVTATETFVGTVMPTQFATIGSAVAGRVIARPFEEGDRVDQGQALAQLLTDTISLEIASAEGELQYRKAQLAELENGARPEEIEQARARMAAAKALTEFREARLARLVQLARSRGAATEDELQEARASAIEARESLKEVTAAHALAVLGPREEVIAQARAQVAIQEAVVERLKDQKTKHTIVSRFAGYVVAEHTEVGQWANQGDAVADVAALDEVDVAVQVVERSVPFVTPGMVTHVEVPAFPGRVFDGVVSTTVPQADVRARTFPVKVRVKNEITASGPLLKAGMYARVALPVGEEIDAVFVPKDAVVLGGPQPVVMVAAGASKPGDKGVASPAPVTLGVAKGDMIQVTGPVEPGALVVVEGNERLRPGQPVIVQGVSGGAELASGEPRIERESTQR